jgi:hypothetical protein
MKYRIRDLKVFVYEGASEASNHRKLFEATFETSLKLTHAWVAQIHTKGARTIIQVLLTGGPDPADRSVDASLLFLEEIKVKVRSRYSIWLINDETIEDISKLVQ